MMSLVRKTKALFGTASALALVFGTFQLAPAQTAPHSEECMIEARESISREDFNDAYRILTRCREDHPKDVNLAALLAEVMIELGSNVEAKQLLNEVLALEPNHKEARLKLSQLHLEHGEVTEAKEHAEFLVRTFPEWPEGNNVLGRCLSEEKDLVTAEIYFKRAVSFDPSNDTFSFNTGVVLLQQTKTEEALEYFGKSIDLNPECSECLFWKGRCLLTIGRRQEGIETLLKLLNDDEWGAQAGYRVGAAMLEAEQPDSAVYYLERAVDKDPSIPAWFDLLAHAYAQAGRPDDAVKAYERAGSLVEEKARFSYEQGRLLLSSGKQDEAARLFCAATDEDKTLAPAWLGLAYALKTTKPLAAAEALSEYINLTPNDLDKRLLLAGWLYEFDLKERSSAEAQSLLDEKLTPAQFKQLGTLLLGLGHAEDAERALRQAVKKIKDDPSLYHNLGVAYERMGDLDKAIEFYERELEFDPTNLTSRLSLAILYFNLERDAESRKHIEILLKKYPGTAEAEEAQEILNEIERLAKQ